MPDIVERADGASPAERLRVRVGSPASLLAAVPPLLGFKPSESSLVVVGAEPPHAEVRMTLRFDLPDARYAGEIVDSAITYLAINGVTSAAVVGYGSGPLVDPVAREFLRRFPDAGITLKEVLRAQGQRYWSYVCQNPECCPPEGTPFDTLAHAAAAKFAGKAVLASRVALAQTIAPVTGEEAEAMIRATRRAEAHARRLIREAGNRTGRKARRRALHGPGLLAVIEAITRYRQGQSLGPCKSTAWLALVLEDLPVRDDAWARMDPEHNAAHLRLWADVTRLAQPGYVAAPASLLAFTAWQCGSGALANIALDRALADQPDYSMARLLRQALDSGAPPSMARLPMSPEEVAASYNAMNSDEEDDDDGDPGGEGSPGPDEQVAGLVS